MQDSLQNALSFQSKMDNYGNVMYERDKLEVSTGYIAWLFGLHYLHVKSYGLFVLFLITCFIMGIGIIRWAGQVFFVKRNVERYNYKLKLLYRVDETTGSQPMWH